MSNPVVAPGPPASAGLAGPPPPAAFAALDGDGGELEDAWALCLSGGGYRAMLFHVGALRRMNELGMLGKVRRVSSVSGGSITAAVLGMNWDRLGWPTDPTKPRVADAAKFQDFVVAPIRKMAGTSIDVSSILWGALKPWTWISDEVQARYRDVLFGDKTLQDLTDDVRFVLNACNVKTGSLWRFAKPYMADYRVGIVDKPTVSLAAAVTASSAFPPVLSPMRLPLKGMKFRPGVPKPGASKEEKAQLASLRTEAILTDGGVYDNLGLEPVWKRYKKILVSDAGRKMDDDLDPGSDWASHSRRLIDLSQHQTSNLRRRTCVGAFVDDRDPHVGTYWGIQTNIKNYAAAGKLYDGPHETTMNIARIETRLTALSGNDQERIINWGYAVCDAALRTHVDDCKNAPAPKKFPYPVGVGVLE